MFCAVILDYRSCAVDNYGVSPPVLMLPSREQNYRDDYFLAIFPKAVRLLQESMALVLVGYSLPDDDALLRFIIRHFCEDEADAHRKVLFYVDMAPAPQQLARLRSVFPFAGTTLTTYTYSGSFAAWAGEVVGLLLTQHLPALLDAFLGHIKVMVDVVGLHMADAGSFDRRYLNFPCCHLGIFLLPFEINLSGADVGMACEIRHVDDLRSPLTSSGRWRDARHSDEKHVFSVTG